MIQFFNIIPILVPFASRNQEETQIKSGTSTTRIDQIIQSQNVPFAPVKSTSTASQAKSHQGVAVPVTMEEIEREIIAADLKLKDSSTSKDGISTWILLSGTHSTIPPEMIKSDSQKAEVNQKVDKIAKVRDTPPKPQRVPVVSKADMIKNKNKNKTITSTTTEPAVSKATIVKESTQKKKQPLHEILPEPVPLAPKVPAVLKQKHKPTATISNSVISVSSKEDAEDEASKENVEMATILPITQVTKETPTPFLVLEPKDADFDLPQDRSPGNTTKKPKRPANKKKVGNKKIVEQKVDDVKNSTKVALKIKDKPMSTKIYNYLSREIMPTVGVGLIGLVVTAGLAGYLLGPLGAIRRSYEVADRKDDLYYYNNEEYAGPGADGQSEEEVFGKVIAGMPVHTNNYHNNVRYVQQNQRPNQFHQGGPQKFVQNQHPPQYSRYRNVAGNTHSYQQRPMQPYISHQPNLVQQRNNLVAPNIISQKSISSSIFAIPSAPTATTTTSPTSSATTPIVDIKTTSESEMVDIVYSSQTEQSLEQIAQDSLNANDEYLMKDDNPNELKRRSQFVVGTVFPESVDPSVVHGALTDDDISAAVPEHGPRRRRRSISAVTQKTLDASVKNTEDLYEKLRMRMDKAEKSDKINKELKHVDYEMGRLRRVIAEVKDIEQFQTELHILVQNSELEETIISGIDQIDGDIKFVNELLDNPADVDSKIANRVQMIKKINLKISNDNQQPIAKKIDGASNELKLISKAVTGPAIETTTTYRMTEPNINYATTARPSGLMGFLKMIELKAAFGVNVLRSIRPAFDKAFEDVFKVNQTQV